MFRFQFGVPSPLEQVGDNVRRKVRRIQGCSQCSDCRQRLRSAPLQRAWQQSDTGRTPESSTELPSAIPCVLADWLTGKPLCGPSRPAIRDV